MSARPIQTVLAAGVQPQPEPESDVRRVFMVLHGFYGNLFSSKFATGIVENGEDQGMASARRVWAHSLREFDVENVKDALRRCRDRHPEFPPSLPQFVALCDASRPRKVWRPEVVDKPLLEESETSRTARRTELRRRASEAAHKPGVIVNEVTGLDALKAAIANAVGAAGGDEAATLLQLDRILAPRRPA